MVRLMVNNILMVVRVTSNCRTSKLMLPEKEVNSSFAHKISYDNTNSGIACNSQTAAWPK